MDAPEWCSPRTAAWMSALACFSPQPAGESAPASEAPISLPYSLILMCAELFLVTFFITPHFLSVILLFLRCIFPEAPADSLAGSAMPFGGSIAEISGRDWNQHCAAPDLFLQRHLYVPLSHYHNFAMCTQYRECLIRLSSTLSNQASTVRLKNESIRY